MASHRDPGAINTILLTLSQALEHLCAKVDSSALFLHRSKWQCLVQSYTVVLAAVREWSLVHNPGMLLGPLVLFSDVIQAAERFLMECTYCKEDERTIDHQALANMANAVMYGMSTDIEDTHLHDLLWCVSLFDRASKGWLDDMQVMAKLREIWLVKADGKADVASTLQFLEEEASLHRHGRKGNEILSVTSFIAQKLSLAQEDMHVVTNVLPKHLWVDPKDLVRDSDPIGKGANTFVFQTEWLGGQYAVKDFFNADFEAFEKEAAIHARLQHPNVVPLVCCTKDPRRRKCSLVMELLEYDLRTFLDEKVKEAEGFKPLSFLTAVDLMLQIAKGMEYLHGYHMIHRDLKSLNILVRLPQLHLKIADFGMSEAKLLSCKYTASSSKLGTTRWRAPEVFPVDSSGSDQECAKYTKKADVYSFALICSEILTGSIPYNDILRANQYNEMKEGVRPNLPSDCPPALASCIKKCWSWEESQRPTFTQICRMLRHIKACIALMADHDKVAEQMLYWVVIPNDLHDRIDKHMRGKCTHKAMIMDIVLEMECCQEVFTGIIWSPQVRTLQTNDGNIIALQECAEIQERIQVKVDTHDLVFLHLSKWQCLAKSYSLVLGTLMHVQVLLQKSLKYRPSMIIGLVKLFSDVLQKGECFLMNCSRSRSSEGLDHPLSNLVKVQRFALSTEIIDIHLHDLLWCVSVFDGAWRDLDVFDVGALVLLSEAQRRLGLEIYQVWIDADKQEEQPVSLQLMSELMDLAKHRDTEISCLAGFILRKVTSLPTENSDYLPPYLQVDQNSFKRDGQVLGAGPYGVVMSAVWWGGQKVALKDVFVFEDNVEFLGEAGIQARLQHANVMSLLCCSTNKSLGKETLVMEVMDQNLRNLITQRHRQYSMPFSLLVAVDIMLQIAKGMEYLHGQHIMHRDLKSTNILVSFPYMSSHYEAIDVKIADFGIAKAKQEMDLYVTKQVGTIPWRAPEVFESAFDEDEVLYYTPKADVYSFAMVCFEVLTGKLPWEGVKIKRLRIRDLVRNGERPSLPSSCAPPVLLNFINDCWHGDPSRRPTFREICMRLRHIKACIVLSDHQSTPARDMLSCQVNVRFEPPAAFGAGSGRVQGLLRMRDDMERYRVAFTGHVKGTKSGPALLRTLPDKEDHDNTGAIADVELPNQTHRHHRLRRFCCGALCMISAILHNLVIFFCTSYSSL